MSSFVGLPRYSISPEPATRAFNSPEQLTEMSPEPATLASTFTEFSLNPWMSPEPATLAFNVLAFPFKVKSPEPATLALA